MSQLGINCQVCLVCTNNLVKETLETDTSMEPKMGLGVEGIELGLTRESVCRTSNNLGLPKTEAKGITDDSTISKLPNSLKQTTQKFKLVTFAIKSKNGACHGYRTLEEPMLKKNFSTGHLRSG